MKLGTAPVLPLPVTILGSSGPVAQPHAPAPSASSASVSNTRGRAIFVPRSLFLLASHSSTCLYPILHFYLLKSGRHLVRGVYWEAACIRPSPCSAI